MTDINKHIGAEKINQIPNLNFEGGKKNIVTAKNYTEKEIKNLDNDPSALVGRSMVKKMRKTPNFDAKTIQNIKGDLAELNANPGLIKKANAVFEAALAKGYPYDKASAIAREFVDSYK